ncbi:MAG: sensor hybrid histidine kinase [Caulobacter sp.]|nr:sensor hybrid histidine kinase [Caulobacter sp.]
MSKRSEGEPPSRIDIEAAGWFFENSLDMFVVLQTGVIVRVNPAWTALTGWPADESVGRPIRDFFHLHDTEAFDRIAADLRSGGQARSEHRLAKRGGGWLWVRSQSKRAEDAALLVVFQDVTEDRARERARQQAERANELLRTAAGIYVWRFDPRQGVYIFEQDIATPALPQGGGRILTIAEMTASIHEDDRDQVWRSFSRTLEHGDHQVLEYRYFDPEHQRWARLRVAWRGVRAHASGRWEVIGISQDITELADARDSALAAAEAKAQFLANMSHEIRTPMNGVLGVMHLLKREPLSDDGRGLLTEALGCGAMLAELLNDIIDFSKIEAGKLELHLEPLDPAALLAGVASLLRPEAEDRGLRLRVVAEPGDGWVLADPVRLRQALFNLIGNATKFTLTGGVEARLSRRGQGEAQHLRFEIEDTGVGISAEAGAGLFERFHQADGSNTRRFGGSGLGLTITRRLAELMGGEIGYDSRPGHGSTFWLDLPVQAAAPPVVEAGGQADQVRAFAGLDVLVVEDNPVNSLIVTRMLQALGARVETAVDGAAGVEAAARGFDLIFMDIQMPGMDGVEAARRIRGLNGAAGAVPIVAMTANALDHQRRAYLAAGMVGAVAKPLAPAALITAMTAALATTARSGRRVS